MKIERYPSPHAQEVTLEDFADKHGLVMEVHQRPDGSYYSRFKFSEVHEGHLLRGVYGDGATEETAIAAYAKEISGKTLTVDGGKTDIPVPQLKYP